MNLRRVCICILMLCKYRRALPVFIGLRMKRRCIILWTPGGRLYIMNPNIIGPSWTGGVLIFRLNKAIFDACIIYIRDVPGNNFMGNWLAPYTLKLVALENILHYIFNSHHARCNLQFSAKRDRIYIVQRADSRTYIREESSQKKL